MGEVEGGSTNSLGGLIMPLQKNVFAGKQRQILLFADPPPPPNATPARAIWIGWPKLKKITTRRDGNNKYRQS